MKISANSFPTNRGLALLVSITKKELEHLLLVSNPVILKATSPITRYSRLNRLPIPLYFAVKGERGIVAAKGTLTSLMFTSGQPSVLARANITEQQFAKKFNNLSSEESFSRPTAIAWEISNISRIFANISDFVQLTSTGARRKVPDVPKGWIYIIDKLKTPTSCTWRMR